MSEPGNPTADVPGDRPAELQRRIGDAERDRAAGYLQEHMAQGRLDGEEFDERLTKALGAKTAGDLEPLFTDLPEPRPAELVAPAPFTPPPWSAAGASVMPAAVPQPGPAVPVAPEPNRMPRGIAIGLAAVWPAAIIISFATDFRFWWIWVVAAMVTVFVRKAFGPGSDHHGYIHGGGDGPPSINR